MRTDGLVEPLIWNATTGNLVGGHQRLAALDELEGGRDYAVTVSVVEVSPQRERELNVWLNNPAVQGQFDHAKLELLFTEFGANPFEAGFERLDLELMFDPATVEQLLATFAPPSDEEVDGEAAGEDAPAGLPGQPEGAVEEARKIQQLKDLRKQWIAGDREDLRADHIVVVVFDAAATASGFLRALKLDEGQTFVASERLGDALDEFYGTVKLAGTMERPEAADEEVDA